MAIRIYTTPQCRHCEDVKYYLRNKGLPFTIVDITRNKQGEELVRKMGGSVPVTVIDQDIIVGFDRTALDRATGK